MKYVLIPIFIHILFIEPSYAQELHAVASRFSESVRNVVLAISIGALALVGGKMMLGSKDAGPLFVQVSIGLGIVMSAQLIHSFISDIAG